ncbi:MAG: hypothetical protein DMG27_16625 [Acidobacteria bacterium]|nr:MAG: hypothetical protein DMG27_16625 [Acidobacteriota bacterium]
MKQVVAQDHIEAVVGRRWREITGRVSIQGVGRNPSNGAAVLFRANSSKVIEASRRKYKAAAGSAMHLPVPAFKVVTRDKTSS